MNEILNTWTRVKPNWTQTIWYILKINLLKRLSHGIPTGHSIFWDSSLPSQANSLLSLCNCLHLVSLLMLPFNLIGGGVITHEYYIYIIATSNSLQAYNSSQTHDFFNYLYIYAFIYIYIHMYTYNMLSPFSVAHICICYRMTSWITYWGLVPGKDWLFFS